MPKRESEAMASMSSFIDFATTSGTSRITIVGDHKRNRHNVITDFYRPVREAIARIGRQRLDPKSVFDVMMANTIDARAANIFPSIVEGHARFLAEHPPIGKWVEPITAALTASAELKIAVNPEIGYVIGDVPHHLKLYLRSEPLSQRRIDFTIATMLIALPLPKGHSVALLDLRNATLHYLSARSADPAASGWRKLSALVRVEAAGYAAAWGMV